MIDVAGNEFLNHHHLAAQPVIVRQQRRDIFQQQFKQRQQQLQLVAGVVALQGDFVAQLFERRFDSLKVEQRLCGFDLSGQNVRRFHQPWFVLQQGADCHAEGMRQQSG